MYVQVSVNGKRWIYSPKCLIPASEDELPEQYGTVHTMYSYGGILIISILIETYAAFIHM